MTAVATLSLCLSSQALRHEDACADQRFLDLGSGWRRVVSLTSVQKAQSVTEPVWTTLRVTVGTRQLHNEKL
jgi:hypothetical protein